MFDTLLLFALASLLVSMAPGPTTVVIIRQSIDAGRPAGVATVLGNETGWLAWCLAAAFGLSALLLASRLAYDVLRVAGAAVLIWFGVQALLRARRSIRRDASADASDGTGGASAAPRRRSRWRCYRMGLLTNLANPKAGVFALSFLPQFVPDGAPVLPTLLLLAVASTLIDLAWYLGVVVAVCQVRRLFQRPAVRRRVEYLSGMVLVALGVRLAAGD
ncbi:LysE family translocator [Actinomadura kijaniata]|uniref:LysE family translocator n=1 Tax=Actinomadura kijaniata TaxID=46161 RepID=UPI000B29394D|nr:LysE family translocator [Actinomadura kijaniata]